MMHGPVRVGGALPVVPCPLCCNAGCMHLPMPWVLVLRCARIISWPTSNQFVYPSRGSYARALEGIHQHWCAVLHPGVKSFSHMCWLYRAYSSKYGLRILPCKHLASLAYSQYKWSLDESGKISREMNGQLIPGTCCCLCCFVVMVAPYLFIYFSLTGVAIS